MGQKTSYPIIRCGIWYSTRANLMGTWGLRRHAVDVAPDGMGWDGNGATEELVGSGTGSAAVTSPAVGSLPRGPHARPHTQ